MGIEAVVDIVKSDCATLYVQLGEWMKEEEGRTLERCRQRLAPMNACAQLLSCDATQFISQAIAQLGETGAHGVTLARQILVARGDLNQGGLEAAFEEAVGSQSQGGGAFEWLEKMTRVLSN